MSIVEHILDQLPHRDPFRFITEIIELTANESGVAEWHIGGDEDFLRGHFPGRPIVPGVLVGESLAQLAGLVGWRDQSCTAADVRLAHIDLRFGATVAPPANVVLHARLMRVLGTLQMFEVRAELDHATVASGTITLAAAEHHTERLVQ